MKQNNLTRKKVLNFRSQGFSLREIALLVDKSLSRVWQIVNGKNSSYRRPLYFKHQSVEDNKIDINTIKFMRDDGKSIRLIAEQLNIPKTRVWRILKKHSTVHNSPLTPKV